MTDKLSSELNLTKNQAVQYCCNAEYRNIINLKNKQVGLNVSNYTNIKNINTLELVHELILSYLTKLTNISSLKSIYKLKLSNCEKIKDISMLNSLRILDLGRCRKIQDIGNLRKLEILTICDNQAEGIHLLKNLKELNIINAVFIDLIGYSNSCDKYKIYDKKMNNRINKLKQINPNVKVKFI